MTIKELFTPLPVLKSDRLEIRPLTHLDALDLYKMVHDTEVYRFVPKNLFELKYNDVNMTIAHLYTECLEKSLILGVFEHGKFCGLVECYGYDEANQKISIGFRSLKEFRGKGVVTETVKLIVDFLKREKKIETITCSTLSQNVHAEQVLMNAGFVCVVRGFPENWGYEQLLPTNKWIR